MLKTIINLESCNKDALKFEIETVKKAILHAENSRMRTRYLAILLHLEGLNNKTIAEKINVSPHTVGTYIRKYKQTGLEGLFLKHSPGAPRMLTEEQEKTLVETITGKSPDEIGLASQNTWTIALVRQWVTDNMGVQYSPRGMAEVLYRLNIKSLKRINTCPEPEQVNQL